MEFGISQETNLTRSKNEIITSLSISLEKYFREKDYGQSIQHFFIGCISVHPDFDFFFEIRQPSYKETGKAEMQDGSVIEIRGEYSHDIKLDFFVFSNARDEDVGRMLAQEILKSLSHLDKLPKKVKDFDKERFKADMEQFFKDEGLI